MASTTALTIVNQLHTTTAQFAREIVTVLADKNIDPWEILVLNMRAMAVASAVLTLLKGTNAKTRREVLQVLEQGQWVLPKTQAGRDM